MARRVPGPASLAVALCACCAVSGATEVRAVLRPPQALLKTVYWGLSEPVALTHAGDGSGRIFIAEKGGRVRVARDGKLLPLPFLDISALVRSEGERGLLALAFSPGFAANGRFYVYHTALDGQNVLARYRVSADPDSALPASREQILAIPHPDFANHNGGMLAFGQDGYLYLGTGDGGGAGDPHGNAQDTGSLLGKILRIDVEGPPSGYRSPPGNPFSGGAPGRDEIWALGLRNPWRGSFDRATGDLYVGDVGQSAVEEIDFLPAGAAGGANLGWNVLEGDRCYPPGTSCTPPAGYLPPALTYTHAAGCSVTGGHVSRSAAYPQLAGLYLYADFCGGWIRGARRSGGRWESTAVISGGAGRVASFGEDEQGAVHVLDLAAGTVSRLVAPLFTDGFSTPGPDADWETATGAWAAGASGAFTPDAGLANLALVAAGRLAARASGRIDVTVTLPDAAAANGSVVFAALDRSRYRYVRLERGRLRIGQVGDFGGAAAGVRTTVAAAVPAGGAVRVRCAVHPSGLVRVYLGDAAAPAASFRFPRAARGRMGLAARRSATVFDAFAAWDHHAIP